jgi:small subunit ribosomal protein S8
MTTDPIADFLIRLKNANRVGKTEVVMPFSKMKHELANLLAKEGYVGDIQKTGKRAIKNMVITLTYKDGKPAIVGTKRISKPSRRIYKGVHEIFPVKRGKGLLVLSTPKGVLTDASARKERVGGEALFEIW